MSSAYSCSWRSITHSVGYIYADVRCKLCMPTRTRCTHPQALAGLQSCGSHALAKSLFSIRGIVTRTVLLIKVNDLDVDIDDMSVSHHLILYNRNI